MKTLKALDVGDDNNRINSKSMPMGKLYPYCMLENRSNEPWSASESASRHYTTCHVLSTVRNRPQSLFSCDPGGDDRTTEDHGGTGGTRPEIPEPTGIRAEVRL